jgi:protein gp37
MATSPPSPTSRAYRGTDTYCADSMLKLVVRVNVPANVFLGAVINSLMVCVRIANAVIKVGVVRAATRPPSQNIPESVLV